MPFLRAFLLKNKALRYPDFRKYLLTRFSLIMALNMQTTIVVYWVYHLTKDVASVGLLGLFEAIPAIGFSLFSGHFVDQREKRGLIVACIAGYVVLSAGYFLLAGGSLHPVLASRLTVQLIYAGIFIGGSLRAFVSPSSFALMGLLIPRKLYQNGATWSSTSWQLGAVFGPLVGGLLIAAVDVQWSFLGAFILIITALGAAVSIPKQTIVKKEKEQAIRGLKEGLKFVFGTQLILTALSLDMFAVLFGGATALLPYFANEVLHVNASGYGWLRAAPGIGTLIMFFLLSWMPLKTNPGIKLLLSIAGFGGCIIVFGLSRIFMVSFLALLLSGAFDAVSVVIRSTILQLYTPDSMRGRVAAVNTMFISSSNEIGEIESGYTAKWMGTVPAVVFGGCMTLLVVGITYFAAPLLRTVTLDAPPEKEKETA